MGGEPGRDESGLPPVDVQIPDDARELDRDVHAYYRELRAQRRRRRAQRLVQPFARHGLVIPVIAGAIAVTLLAGTLLTVIASPPEPISPVPLQPRSPVSPAVPPAGHLGGLLPDATVSIGHAQVNLRELVPSVLAVVPGGCSCLTVLRQITSQAMAAQVKIFFIAAPGAAKQVASLAAQAGQGYAQVADDTGDVLGIYHPAGLTAILVHSDGAVTSVMTRLAAGADLAPRLSQLATPGLGTTASIGSRPSLGSRTGDTRIPQGQAR